MDELNKDLAEMNWETILKIDKEDPNFSYGVFEREINKIIDKHMPMKKLTKKEIKQQNKPWITKGIRISMKRRERLFNKYVRAKTKKVKDDYHKKYKDLRNQLVTLCRKSKVLYYQNFFSKNARNTWIGIKSIINISQSKNTKIDSLIVDRKMINNPKDIADNFNNYFSSIARKLQDNLHGGHDFKTFLSNRNDKSFFITPTDKYEISDMIKSLNSNKSTGPHSIPTNILKNIEKYVTEPLSRIINVSFSTGVYIESLKISKVVPIYKEKGDILECTNYRPISLLSNINKIIEKLMHKRLYSFLNVNKCIYELQFGFRKNHSTNHALIDLTEDIRGSLDNNMFAVGVFIDLQKAFDTVDHNILLSKLEHYGIRGISYNWFKSYLTNRKQYVLVNETKSKLLSVNFGVPQGSVLGPLLFLLYINDLNKAIKYSTTRHFADDTSLLIKKKSLKQLQKQLNIDLKSLYKWLNANKISLNVGKTELIIFRNIKKEIDYDLKIKINGKKLLPTTHVKYLGIYLDSHLKWNYHCEILAAKLSRMNGLLSKIRYYVTPNTLKEIYFAIFSSLMLYNAQIWGQYINKYVNRITKLQNKALRIINFAQYDSPKDTLYKNSNILKFSDNIKVLNILYVYDSLKRTLPNILNNNFHLQKNNHSYMTKGSIQSHVNLPKSYTESYGIRSINFQSARTWNDAMVNLSEYNVINRSSVYCRYMIMTNLINEY